MGGYSGGLGCEDPHAASSSAEASEVELETRMRSRWYSNKPRKINGSGTLPAVDFFNRERSVPTIVA